MNLTEFNPAKIYIEVAKKRYYLKPFSLELEAMVIDEFGSLNGFMDAINKDSALLISYFNKFMEGEKFTPTLANTTVAIGQKIYSAFVDNIMQAMPLVKYASRHKEYSEAMGKENKVDYAKYYDTLAKRYGYSIQDFYNLTSRQLKVLLETANDSIYEELEVKAALQGRKLKPRVKMFEVSEEEEKENDAAAQDLLAGMRRAHELKVNQNGQ